MAQALAATPDIGAIYLECGDMTLVSDALRVSFGLPVVDYLNAGSLLHAISVHAR